MTRARRCSSSTVVPSADDTRDTDGRAQGGERMADVPSGKVTFLMTDIEGSTRRWESGPELMRAALAEHDEVLRAVIEKRGGWLFKHTGDGVCAAFSSAPDAVAAAVAAQRVLGLLVRMGVGTGTAELRGGDYFGPALNRAARVMAAGTAVRCCWRRPPRRWWTASS